MDHSDDCCQAFEFVSRTEWGAGKLDKEIRTIRTPVQEFYIHHTGSEEEIPCFDINKCIGKLKPIKKYHIETEGM